MKIYIWIIATLAFIANGLAQTKDCANKLCTKDYNPVCGYDGQKHEKYSNNCLFELAQCDSENNLEKVSLDLCDNNGAK
ncbi:turripeptide Pal9.2-like isoform X2 [Ceratitis capitata]|uniref:turripeptide Pal9.2-like isoform X2 n=1 Tax=Ceratitis capitata TaxID=7213 RepID=UPI000A10744A|nr:turripeptide Pal9.2-like isoform X2 [Ceratitis capitata]